jgi:hypothetical protein
LHLVSNVIPDPERAFPLVAGRYELLRQLGSGSFGRTFLGHDRDSGRHVAIKLLDPRAAADWKSIELFEREAAVLGTLRHHGVPEVHEVLRSDWEGANATFLVMEYVEGESLAQVITEGRTLDPAVPLELFLELLAILEYLHTRVPPVLHRDIKPANILLRPSGMPALVDFGAVRSVFLGSDEHGSTVAGTYGYMPYEQFMGQATPSSDLYALAATFLHLITGRPPRDFMSDAGDIAVPADLPGDARLRPVLSRMLRRAPAERFDSARVVKQALLGGAAVPSPVPRVRPHGSALAQTVLATSTPRDMRGAGRKLLDEMAPSVMQLMDGSAKKGDKPGVADWAVVTCFSILTAGILPITFFAVARSRRRRLGRFVRDGVPGIAEITHRETERSLFDAPIAKVSYEFTVEGQVYRDVDTIRPAIADRWQVGDVVQILYLPEFNYDSVIISTA